MTPKEEAKELIEKFLTQEINFQYIDTEDGQCIGSGYMTFNSAKKCALTAVGLILEGNHLILIRTPLSHWQQVKEEIIKL